MVRLTAPPPRAALAPRDGEPSPRGAAVPWPALGTIVLLAALLRFPTLGVQSLWFDEAATWELMRLPFGEMLSELPGRESNPPLFYVLEWVWVRIFGDGEFGLRSLSALVGTLTVPVAYGIGNRLAGARAGLATAVVVAVNPLLIWFSQEVRSYELVVFLSACSLLLFLRCLDDDRPRALAWWALVSVLALCTHYFAVFMLAPQVVWLLLRHPRRHAVLAAVAGIAVVGAALLPMLLEQRDNPYDIAGDSIGVRLLQVPKQFLLGYRGPLAVLTVVLGAALVAAGVWLLARRVGPGARRRALGIGAIGLLAVALPVAGAIVGADYLNARNMIPALVPLAATLGVAYGASAARRVGVVLLAALCALSVAIVVSVAVDQQYQRPDWKGLAEALGDSDEQRAIVISPGNGEAPLRFYLRDLRPMRAEGTLVRQVDVVGVAGSRGPGEKPVLPEQYGLQLQGGFGPPQRIASSSYVFLRFTAPQPVRVDPVGLSVVRFASQYPSVDVLPPDR